MVVVGYSQNETATAFSFAASNFRALTLGLRTATNEVISVSAATPENGWGAGGYPGNPVPGISVTNQGNEWFFNFNEATLAGALGAMGNLVFNGTLTVIVPEE